MADDLPRFVQKEAEAAEDLVEAYRDQLKVALLGPGEPFLKLRVHAHDVLSSHGYKSLLMERYPDVKGELLQDKWRRMVDTERPTHYFVVVPKENPKRGAHVEFGYLIREHGTAELIDRVRFFIEAGADVDAVLAPYEVELVGLVGVDFWRDPDQLARRMARRIDNLVFGRYG